MWSSLYEMGNLHQEQMQDTYFWQIWGNPLKITQKIANKKMYSQVHSSDNLSPLFNLVKKKVMSVPNKYILACFFRNDNFCRSRLKKYQAHRLPEITQTFVSCLPSSVVFLDFIITKVDAFHGCGWSLCFERSWEKFETSNNNWWL